MSCAAPNVEAYSAFAGTFELGYNAINHRFVEAKPFVAEVVFEEFGVRIHHFKGRFVVSLHKRLESGCVAIASTLGRGGRQILTRLVDEQAQ
jgi:hypothetical protein